MTSAFTVFDGSPVASTFEYDAFVSYRRGDGKWYAQVLRQRLLGVRIPPEVTSAVPHRRLRIYLDQIYERATDDFFEHTIKPALRASRHLVVVQSPSSAQLLSDGRANWLEREIEYFRSLPPEGRSISVAVTSGEPAGPLPGRLHETHPNLERHDLRRWRWYRTADADDALLTLTATLHDISPADMPALRQEDARRRRSQKRRRLALAGAGALLLLLAGAVALWQYVSAREALVRRNTAMAAALWNRLDFTNLQKATPDELNALWELASADSDVRTEFLDQLPGNALLAARLGRGQAAVLRAILLRWPPARAQSVHDAILAAVDSTSNDGRLRELSLALYSSASTLTPQQAQAAFAPLYQRLLKTEHDDAEKCAAFEWGLRGLANRLPGEQVSNTFTTVVNALVAARVDVQVASLGWTAYELAKRLPERDTTAAVTLLLEAFPRVEDGLSEHKPALALSLTAVADRLTPDQTRAAFSALLESMDGAYAEELTAIVPALKGVSGRVSAREARAAFAALLKASDVPGPDVELLDAIGATAGLVSSRLDGEGARVSFAKVLKAIAATNKPDILEKALGPAAYGAASVIPERDALAAYFTVRQTILGSGDASRQLALGMAARGLAKRISPPDADALLILTLAADSAPTLFATLAVGAAPLADRVPARQAESLLDLVMEDIRKQTDSYRLGGLGAMAQRLAAQLTPAQVMAFAPTIRKDLERSTSVQQLKAYGAALEGAADNVTPDQAEALLPPILTALVKADVLSLESWAPVGAKLAARISPAAAEAQFPHVLAAIQTAGMIPQYDAVTAMIEVMADKVSPALAATASGPLIGVLSLTDSMAHFPAFERVVRRKGGLNAAEQEQIRSRLAWATTPASSRIWAEALVRLFPRNEPVAFVGTLVGALKFPTTAGEPTDVLLEGLRTLVPDAPGATPGLEANLKWIQLTFPAIDLAVPPACPAPSSAEFACPTPRAIGR